MSRSSSSPLDVYDLSSRPAPRRSGDDQMRPIDRFLVKDRGRLAFVEAVDVETIEAAGNYIQIHARSGRYHVRQSLQRVVERLDPGMFCRIHRSTIVNLRHIRELFPLSHGNYTVVLTSGRKLTMTREYRRQFESHWML